MEAIAVALITTMGAVLVALIQRLRRETDAQHATATKTTEAAAQAALEAAAAAQACQGQLGDLWRWALNHEREHRGMAASIARIEDRATISG